MDDEWRLEELPHEQVSVPSEKLPDPEADNGDSHLTLLEQVNILFRKHLDRLFLLSIGKFSVIFPCLLVYYQQLSLLFSFSISLSDNQTGTAMD